jgi:hypothetical protein
MDHFLHACRKDTLQFVDPGQVSIDYHARLLEGPGAF